MEWIFHTTLCDWQAQDIDPVDAHLIHVQSWTLLSLCLFVDDLAPTGAYYELSYIVVVSFNIDDME